MIFKESALGRFFHRVAMSVCLSDVPFHAIFLLGRTGVEPILLHAWSPSYYTHGALKTGGGCRASIAHAWSRRVDACTRGCVDAWTRQPPHFIYFFIFCLDKSRKLSKIVSVLRSASVERFGIRDFFYRDC